MVYYYTTKWAKIGGIRVGIIGISWRYQWEYQWMYNRNVMAI
jgi:hypothetical protein